MFCCGIVVFDDKSLETSFSCHPWAVTRGATGSCLSDRLLALCLRDRDAMAEFVNDKVL